MHVLTLTSSLGLELNSGRGRPWQFPFEASLVHDIPIQQLLLPECFYYFNNSSRYNCYSYIIAKIPSTCEANSYHQVFLCMLNNFLCSITFFSSENYWCPSVTSHYLPTLKSSLDMVPSATIANNYWTSNSYSIHLRTFNFQSVALRFNFASEYSRFQKGVHNR